MKLFRGKNKISVNDRGAKVPRQVKQYAFFKASPAVKKAWQPVAGVLRVLNVYAYIAIALIIGGIVLAVVLGVRGRAGGSQGRDVRHVVSAQTPAPDSGQYTDYYEAFPDEPEPTPLPAPLFVELRSGDDSLEVQKLQEQLMELHYLESDESTQHFGPATQFALQLFQRQHGLQVDGIAGVETQKLLYGADAKPYIVFPGSYGLDVIDIQKRLHELGYFKGAYTKKYGDTTEKAVREFQKNNKLVVDAKIGMDTRDILFSPLAKPAFTPAPSKKPAAVSNAKAKIEKFITYAEKQKGKRYVWGAEGPNTFDCSGFVYYCLDYMGINYGRFAAAGFRQVTQWKEIKNIKDIKRGDLLFWKGNGRAVGHTGIYIGSNKIIHASSSNGKVLVSAMKGYYVRNFVGARRVWA